jgi:beta-glucosidase
MDGEEVVQLYYHTGESLPNRPVRQLGAFSRVVIPRGKTLGVVLNMPVESLKTYNPERGQFVFVPGTVTLEVGTSSGDIRLSNTLSLDIPSGEKQ